jgi:hypothetical protein
MALAAGMLLALTVVAGCRGARWDRTANVLRVDEPTTESSHVTWRMTTLGTDHIRGMQVDTVGGDTVVTRTLEGRARRFVLKGLVGYRGEIGIDRVHLVFAHEEVSVRIDDHAVKLHGPERTLDVRLVKGDEDVFGGRDVVVDAGGVRAADG